MGNDKPDILEAEQVRVTKTNFPAKTFRRWRDLLDFDKGPLPGKQPEDIVPVFLRQGSLQDGGPS